MVRVSASYGMHNTLCCPFRSYIVIDGDANARFKENALNSISLAERSVMPQEAGFGRSPETGSPPKCVKAVPLRKGALSPPIRHCWRPIKFGPSPTQRRQAQPSQIRKEAALSRVSCDVVSLVLFFWSLSHLSFVISRNSKRSYRSNSTYGSPRTYNKEYAPPTLRTSSATY